MPWNIYVRAGRDVDLDELIAPTEEQLLSVVRTTIEQLEQLAAELSRRKANPPKLCELMTNGVNLFALLARLELLEQLKSRITPSPPVVISEAEAIRIADQRWKDWDRTYDEWDMSRAVGRLKDEKLMRLHVRPKTRGCRYTFLKPPAKYPNAYRAFRQVAEYYGTDETLGAEGTSFVGYWDRAQSTPARIVVTADVARKLRTYRAQPEPPIDPPTTGSSAGGQGSDFGRAFTNGAMRMSMIVTARTASRMNPV